MAAKGLVWFRADLRLSDNPALAAALSACGQVEALFVLETDAGLRPLGGASRAWLAESLALLRADLAAHGIPLAAIEGESAVLVPRHAHDRGIEAVFWNRRYAPAERDHDSGIKSALDKAGIATKSFNAALLAEPWEIATKAGKPYSVFTPFRTALRQKPMAPPVRRPPATGTARPPRLALFDARPAWAGKIMAHWSPGEAAAHKRLQAFLTSSLGDYARRRELPAEDGTSRLSPHLRFGEIGPRQIWAAATHAMDADPAKEAGGTTLLSELAWREFSHHLLYHRPDIARFPMREKFKDLPWRRAEAALERWQRGMTGIPIVDAGMRQLWETGWMHNRVRMIVASLLVKNLLIDWRAGESWFWDTLVDADPGNNPMNWQWVAGTGADASPFFRIFNPVTQGERFDPEGDYVKTWVPELAGLPAKSVHAPWTASSPPPPSVYPAPIVDLRQSRERALAAFSALR